MNRSYRIWIAGVCSAGWLVAGSALAFDGGGLVAGGDTYYEEALAADPAASAALESGAAAAAGLPSDLAVYDAEGAVEYRQLGAAGGVASWEVALEIAERPHERVDAVYDLVLALALPEGWSSSDWQVEAREGSEARSVAAVYGGEKVSLKRNPSLESSWLPVLLAGSGGLPDLSGTGYAWTLWDTILRYNASRGDTLQGFATFQYSTDLGVSAPDPGDSGAAAFVISWIPTLDPSVPPFTLRLPVVAPEEN